jgi:uridine monophosphate synthetase
MSEPSELSEKRRAFADALLATGAVKFGAFRLKLHEKQPDAPLSPIYVDLRTLRSFPDALDAAVAALAEMIAEMIAARGLAFDLYADVPQAATPLVAVLSHLTRVGMITPREAKTHGAGEAINGAYSPGQTVLVIDDLVTRAESKLEAIRVLEANGLLVRDVAVLVDREQGGAQELAAAGYHLHAAVTLTQLLDHWRATGGLDEATYERVGAYTAQAQR